MIKNSPRRRQSPHTNTFKQWLKKIMSRYSSSLVIVLNKWATMLRGHSAGLWVSAKWNRCAQRARSPSLHLLSPINLSFPPLIWAFSLPPDMICVWKMKSAFRQTVNLLSPSNSGVLVRMVHIVSDRKQLLLIIQPRDHYHSKRAHLATRVVAPLAP